MSVGPKLQSGGLLDHFCFLKQTKTIAESYTKGIHSDSFTCLPLSLAFARNIEFKGNFPVFESKERVEKYFSTPHIIIFMLQDNLMDLLCIKF